MLPVLLNVWQREERVNKWMRWRIYSQARCKQISSEQDLENRDEDKQEVDRVKVKKRRKSGRISHDYLFVYVLLA
jgi:hypothetical protein